MKTMINTGKFYTTTKIKISTPNGNVLKVSHYNIDEEPWDEYKIRPKCSICGGDVGCVCYSENNVDDPLQKATDGLKQKWTCEKTHCVYKFLEQINSEEIKRLKLTYGEDEQAIVEELQDEYCEEEEIFCEV
jgi:hypothetical protein